MACELARRTRYTRGLRQTAFVKKILLTGKTGQLGWELQQSLAPLGKIFAPSRAQMDLTDSRGIRTVIRELAPDIIVNAAGYTTVDRAEVERELAYQVNTVAPEILAEEARRANALLVHYSTDYVYDGTKHTPYDENDAPTPVNYYGKSKLEGERAIISTRCAHLILRASWIYSARGTNFVLTMLRLAREKPEVFVVNDQVGSPSWAKSLAQTSSEIINKINHPKETLGTYHLSAIGHTTRFDFARHIVDVAKQSSKSGSPWAEIHPTTTENYPLPAKRPLNAATSKAKVTKHFGIAMPTWQEQLEAFVKTIQL